MKSFLTKQIVRLYCCRRRSLYALCRCFFIVPLFVFLSTVHAQPSLVFNVTGQPPLNTLAHDGFMDEVTREMLNRIGYTLDIDRLPAERGLRNADNGFIDGEMSRVKGIDKVYKNLVRVPEKMMDWGFYVFSKKPINLQQGWDSLSEADIAFIRGWKILEKNIPKTASITRLKNSSQLFTLLGNDRTDYIVYERWGGQYLIEQLGLYNIKLRSPALATKEMFLYVHKKHQALVPKLSQALLAMKKDGHYQRLVKKHLLLVAE